MSTPTTHGKSASPHPLGMQPYPLFINSFYRTPDPQPSQGPVTLEEILAFNEPTLPTPLPILPSSLTSSPFSPPIILLLSHSFNPFTSHYPILNLPQTPYLAFFISVVPQQIT